MDDIPPSHPIDVDDLETAIREGRHLHRARAYRIKVADETLDFRPIEVVDPMPLGRQILEAAGAQPIDEFSVFALLPHGDFEDVRLDEPFDLRGRGPRSSSASARTGCSNSPSTTVRWNGASR